jgi:hypothetical protein
VVGAITAAAAVRTTGRAGAYQRTSFMVGHVVTSGGPPATDRTEYEV